MLQWFSDLFSKPERAHDPWILEQILPLHNAFEGLVCTGGTGSGKSTGPMYTAIMNLLRLPGRPGFLVLTCKPGEPQVWREYARLAGRTGDLEIFGPGHTFNFLRHELIHGGVTAGAVVMSNLLDASTPSSNNKGEQFFRESAKSLIRHAVAAVWLGTGDARITDLVKFIYGLAASKDELRSAEWRQGFVADCMVGAHERGFASDIDFNQANDYISGFWPSLGDKTQGSIVAEAMVSLNPFLGSEVSPLVNGDGIPLSPADIERDGKIVVPAATVLSHGEGGRMVNLAWKLCTQRHLLRRQPTPEMRIVVMVTDEANWFAVAGVDALVQSVARASKLINIMAFQNIPLLQKSLGGDHAKVEVEGWLSNFQCWVACQNPDPATNSHVSKLIGESLQTTLSGGSPADFDIAADLMGERQKGGGASWTEKWLPKVRPEIMANELRKGGYPHKCVDAIVWAGGRRLPGGDTWCKATFNQRI